MRTLLFLSLLLSCLASSAAAQEADDPTGAGIAEVFLAKSDAEGRAGEPAANFSVTDIPIFCVVRLHAPGVAQVKLDFIAAKVAGVKPESRVVSITYTTKKEEDRVNFSGKPHGLWVPGQYRVDIYVGDRKVKDISFEITGSKTEATKPAGTKPSPTKRRFIKRPATSDRQARQTLGRAFW